MADDEGDEDWFERAFEEGTADGEAAEERADSDDGHDDADDERADSDDGHDDAEGEHNEGPGQADDTDPAQADDADPERARDERGGEPASESPPDGEQPSTRGSTPQSDRRSGGQPDEDEFAAAFGGGGPEREEGEDLFEDDFADAFGGGGQGGMDAAGGGGDFGFDLDADVGAGAPGGFEADEDYESDIPRIDFGIEGLDEMIQGGVPERSLIVAIGEAGTGKTTFGLQFLHEALENGERAVFITLEESRQRVVQSATEKGWAFDRHTEEGDLAVVDIDPIEMANSLTSIRNELPRLVEEFGASRLVLDSVSLLEMMYDDQSTRRTEIYDFTKSLKEAGVTTMVTSEASEDNSFASRYGVIEYLTDAVVVLRYIRPEDFRETRLAVEIQKIRDANHSRETKPYEITHQGISVYRQANIF
ncbi:KaiC domain-containing protein [Halobacterium yunchengense]|uniref:KaiC domain-containing protein n=1 Tax=Halobacterium yunchengense TaxID=3108497 RepID=UPI0030096B25